MKTIAAQLEKAYPETNKGETIVVTPLLENLVGKYRTNLGLLLGALGWCADRVRELGESFCRPRRSAVARVRPFAPPSGASRGQIVKQLLVESFVVRDDRWNARIFHRALGAGRVVDLGAAKCFQVSGHPIRSAGVDVHVGLLHRSQPCFSVFGRRGKSSRADVQLALKAGSQGSGDAASAKRTRDWLGH